MVGQTKSLKVYRMLMVQKVEQEPVLSLRAGRRLTCFADMGLTSVVVSVWHPSLHRCPVD